MRVIKRQTIRNSVCSSPGDWYVSVRKLLLLQSPVWISSEATVKQNRHSLTSSIILLSFIVFTFFFPSRLALFICARFEIECKYWHLVWIITKYNKNNIENKHIRQRAIDGREMLTICVAIENWIRICSQNTSIRRVCHEFVEIIHNPFYGK